MIHRDPGRLHVLTDTRLQRLYDHVELAALAFSGGADVVQIREKDPSVGHDERVRIAREVLARPGARRVLIDDHVDVARAAGAHGVHLGPRDLPVAEARRRLGPTSWIGSTANDVAEATSARHGPADYLGVGPVFETRSKAAPAAALGLARLAEIVAAVTLPVIAIGGIDGRNVADVMATGVHGVAVLSAVVCAADPRSATLELRRRLDATVARIA